MLRRVSVVVAQAEAEEARARMLELAPEGFEERWGTERLELAAYTDDAGEARMRRAFGRVAVGEVEQGWETRWREFHRPVRIGPLWVGPPWEEPPRDAIAVVVEPARAFGTGAHPTTRLCLERLVELERGSLLDVGCGSGVLAIAGALLGFGPVEAVDLDPEAVAATNENARANDVEVAARVVDAATELPAVDVVVANVSLAVVEELAPRLRCRRAVTSGYLSTETPRLDGWRHVRRSESAGWACDLYASPDPD